MKFAGIFEIVMCSFGIFHAELSGPKPKYWLLWNLYSCTTV